MSFRLSVFAGCMALALLGGLLLGRALRRDKAHAQVAKLSEPQTAAANTNLNQPARRKGGLLQLEEELSRSFQGLKPNSSLDSVTAPTLRPRPAPVIQNRRAKDLQDRRKNWIFAKPEDPTAGPKLEELMNVPEYGADGQEKKSLPQLERYYQDLTRRGAGKANSNPFAEDGPSALHKGRSTREETSLPEDSNTPSAIREREQTLRKLLGADMANFTPAPVRGSLSDIFGFGDKGPSPQEELAHKASMKEFQQWLDRPKDPSGGGSLPNALGAIERSRQPISAPGGLNASTHLGQPNGLDAQAGALNPALAFGTLSDVNKKVLNQWNPLYVPPKVEPPKVTPPAANFEVPRRRF